MSKPDSIASTHHAEVLPGIWVDGRMAVWIAAERLLAVADLHWGYAASHRARGNLLPWWGDDQIELRLRHLIRDYSPTEILWLGDVVHAAEGAGRAEQFLRDAPVPVTVLAGNHDRRWKGRGSATAIRGRYFFHHGDLTPEIPAGCFEVLGHHHPAVMCSDGAGGNIRLPALVASAHRLILPAFSPWATGIDWTPRLDPASTLWAISPKRIFAVRAPTGVAV